MAYRNASTWQVKYYPKNLRDRVIEGWAELLGRYQWDVFATWTWAKSTSSEVMIRNICYWLYLWQLRTALSRGLAFEKGERVRDGRTVKQYGGSWMNGYRKGNNQAIWVAGIERGQATGRLHAHGVIKWSSKLSNLTRTEGWELWFKELGYGRATFVPPESQEDVTSYVSKYVVKGGDLRLSPSFNAARLSVPLVGPSYVGSAQ